MWFMDEANNMSFEKQTIEAISFFLFVFSTTRIWHCQFSDLSSRMFLKLNFNEFSIHRKVIAFKLSLIVLKFCENCGLIIHVNNEKIFYCWYTSHSCMVIAYVNRFSSCILALFAFFVRNVLLENFATKLLRNSKRKSRKFQL